MNILEVLLLNAMFIMFPLLCYFIYVINEQNLGRKASDVLFDLALFSSLYFLLKYDMKYAEIRLMFLTIPLLIAYLKNKNITTIIFSFTIGLYYFSYFKIDIIYIILEFVLYFIAFHIIKKKQYDDTISITAFAIVKIVFMMLEINYIPITNIKIIQNVIILPFIFYFVTNLIYYLLIKSEKIMSLHMSIKELEKEKQLRDSLFKITHEIKNPIAVCKGYLDMLDIDNNNQVKKYIPIIRQEIERTLTLMNDFMNLTKLNVEKRDMDASVLLQDISEIAYLMLNEKKITYESSIIDNEVYINGDYNRLKQVFINLIKNAMEAIPTNKTGAVKFESKINANNLIIIIKDNGVGMNKEALNKIGEAFYTTKSNGTGLGVKLSKEIIEAHNGSIEYKSKIKVGTSVIITLPLKKSLA
jgi:two-component system sporulation sensor kinase B